MLAIRVRKGFCEKIRKELIGFGLIDSGKEILSENSYAYIGLKRAPNKQERKKLREICTFKIMQKELKKIKKEPKSLKEALKNILSEQEFKELKSSFDVIGQIAILVIPPELEKKEKEIGNAILKIHKNVRCVTKRAGIVSGEFRVRPLKIIAGEKIDETIYKEHNCVYKLNPSKVFFTPRLATERARICKLVKEGEIVIDMFAGIGPFSILIAKKAKPKKIYSVDINPNAYKYLKENIKLNKAENIIPIFGDSRVILKKIEKADRIIMNLPKYAYNFIPYALNALKSKGIIHYHCFVKEGQEAVNSIKEIVERKRKFELLNVRKVRQVSPKEWNLAIDFRATL